MTLFADSVRQRQREKREEEVQGACVGGHNLKMYKKYIKRKSPRCLRSLCACCLRVKGVFPLPIPSSPSCVCVSRCVCVWRVLITSQKVKLGQNASAAEHEPTSQCVCVCVCVRLSVCVCVCGSNWVGSCYGHLPSSHSGHAPALKVSRSRRSLINSMGGITRHSVTPIPPPPSTSLLLSTG